MGCLVEVKKENSSSSAHWLEYYRITVSCKRGFLNKKSFIRNLAIVKIVINSFEKKIIIYLRKEKGRIKKVREREGARAGTFNSKAKRPSDYWAVDTINNNKNPMTWNDCRLS